MNDTKSTSRKITFRNFRSFKDKQTLHVSPITILLGGNGVGKSSIARIFPMIKQTYEKRSKSFLWFGHYVDFGTFENIKSINSEKDEFSLEFTIPFDKFYIERISNKHKNKQIKNINPSEEFSFELKFNKSANGLTSIQKISLSHFDIECSFKPDLSFNDFKINGNSFKKYFANNQPPFIAPVPIPRLSLTRLTSDRKELKFLSDYINSPEVIRELEIRLIRLDLLKELSGIFKDKFTFKFEDLETYGYREPRLREFKKLFLLNEIDIKIDQNLKNIFSELEPTKKQYIRNLFMIEDFTNILSDLNEYFHITGSELRYIAPVRSSIDRFYRNQELDINEISPDGSNVAVYLNSFNDIQKKNFHNWTSQHLGFTISAVSAGAHIELKICHQGSDFQINLADTGFGYSQLLPIIAQIWNAIEKTKADHNTNRFFYYENIRDLYIVLEQPELHLHPALQSKLANIFIAAHDEFKKNGINSFFIIETHSEALLNKIGDFISENTLSPHDVSLNFIEAIDIDQSQILKRNFDSFGRVENWPIGFFSGE